MNIMKFKTMDKHETILVTGGTGYIGSHVCVELLALGYELVIFDNFSNSSPKVIDRLQNISGQPINFIEGDIRSAEQLTQVFEAYNISAVLHFAGLKAVGESTEKPLLYYDNHITGTVNLLNIMSNQGCKNIVFSSSATVYGEAEKLPITEDAPLSATNPYGRSKLMIENILTDLSRADSSWNVSILRYFNPVGAHASGLMGESPSGRPNNLMPYISQVAIGRRGYLSVFGNDYKTHDGTGVRDYIHVVDLARGHVQALQAMAYHKGLLAVNLGTGRGYSVLEMVRAFEQASGKTIPYEIMPRRAGDIASCYADPTLAKIKLDWVAHYDLHKMCEDTWRWQSMNPQGYD